MPAHRAVWAALAVLLLLAVPSAAAFATREEPVRIAYARDDTPVVFATGALTVEGDLRGGYLAAQVRGVTLRDVPSLTVTERGDVLGLPQETTYRDVDLVVHDGALVWRFDEGASLSLVLDAPYGLGLALPEFPSAAVERGPGALVAAPGLQGTLSWTGEGDLLLLDAEATLLDARGQPVAGWERRDVNPGATAASDPSTLETVLHVKGAFRGDADARIQGGAVGASRDLSLRASPSDEDSFGATLDVLSDLGTLLGPDAAGAFGPDNPLRQLETFSPLLNGALLIVATPLEGEEGEDIEPIESRLGEDEFDAGPISLLRGDPMTVAWDESQMRIQGTPTVAVSRAGFAVEQPATVWLFPLVAVVLWALAIAALVVYFVKRPPKADAPWTMRLLSYAVYLLVLLAVFWFWDASFASTFGTSVLSLVRAGTAFDDLPRLGLVAGVQMAPWGLSALLFALPVRIALGVGLRYLGKGKAYKGLAMAAGLVALGLLGPLYALWILNTVITEALGSMPSLFG